jgi:dTDP-glucose 4,6-dehydratase
MRLLVTGGAGFIGSTFVRRAVEGAYPELSPVSVTVLDALTYAGNLANLDPIADRPGWTFVEGDICDAAAVDTVMRDVNAVVHFAAESHVDRSILGASAFVMTNVLGTQTLLDAALRHGVDRFLHVSTDEVYGSIDAGSSLETDPLRPSSPYAASKASSDLIARAYAVTHGLDVVVTRCSNNYGPYQFPEKLMSLFITTLLEGGTVPLYGDGGNVRDWLHADDHCHGIQLALTRGRAGETYNIGGGTELSNRELTERLLAACGADWSRVRYVTDRPGHDRRYSLDWSKARRELGYEPQMSFDDGLSRTVAWYVAHPEWWRPLKAAATPMSR